MKIFKVLGSGCKKCNDTMDFIAEVAKAESTEIQLEKVSDPTQIMKYKVMSTPAVVLNEKVVHTGSIPSRKQILAWL